MVRRGPRIRLIDVENPVIRSAFLLAAAVWRLSAGDVAPVADFDLNSYQGLWYEIARYPNWFQRSCAGDVTAEYRTRDDGKITVLNRCLKKDGSVSLAEGIARTAGPPASKLKVRFAPKALSWLPVVWADYWVIALAPDYSWAVIGGPGRKYLWILARRPELDAAVYAGILERIRALGYDPARLQATRHRPPAQ
jgi:apolipoprotein D and lipocalin family protein